MVPGSIPRMMRSKSFTCCSVVNVNYWVIAIPSQGYLQNKAIPLKPAQLYHPKVLNTVKVLLLLLTFGFIFYKLFYAYHLETLIRDFTFSWSPMKSVMLASATLLMCMNWMLEAGKWQLLINKKEPVDYRMALRAVLSGVALSIITPNQVGDFAGRVLHLKQLDKIKGALVTVIGHTAQVIMTIAFGLFGFTWLLHAQGHLSTELAALIYVASSVLIITALILFTHIHLIGRIAVFPKLVPYLQVFSGYTRGELGIVLLYALLRYLIFIFQYLLLLRVFGVVLTPVQSLCCIIGTLFAQSFVPSFILVEIGMRGASALFFFSLYSSHVTGILLSAYSLWIINLMLPALLGLWFILKMRFGK